MFEILGFGEHRLEFVPPKPRDPDKKYVLQCTFVKNASQLSNEKIETYDPRTTDMDWGLGMVWLEVFTDEQAGIRVAYAQFVLSESSCHCAMVSVEKNETGQGISQALYDLIENSFAMELKPSNDLTDSGRRL